MTALRCAIIVVICAIASAARADTVGVVVTGDPLFQGPVAARVEDWLKRHAYDVVPTPLDADAFNTLDNCLLLDDLDCARNLIDARATSNTVVYLRITTADTDMTVSAWWFVKGHDAAHDHGTCSACAPDGWRPITDTVLISITGANMNLGHLDLRSHPGGASVRLDGRAIGTTPVALDVPAGDHVVVLERGTTQLARRAFTVTPGETTAIDIPVKPKAPRVATERRSNAGALVAIVGGAIAIVGGGYVIYYGHDENASSQLPGATPIGAVLAGAGLVSLVAGAVLYDRAPGTVVSLTPRGAFVGYSARF
jgi:hypothetical protein